MTPKPLWPGDIGAFPARIIGFIPVSQASLARPLAYLLVFHQLQKPLWFGASESLSGLAKLVIYQHLYKAHPAHSSLPGTTLTQPLWPLPGSQAE